MDEEPVLKAWRNHVFCFAIPECKIDVSKNEQLLFSPFCKTGLGFGLQSRMDLSATQPVHRHNFSVMLKSMNRWLRLCSLALGLAGGFWLYTSLRSGHVFTFHRRTVKLVEAAPQSQYEPGELDNIQIYRRVRPAVVNITSQIIQYSFLFGPEPASGQGSGFFINSHGYILTNYHVIRGATRLRVTWTPARNQSRTFNATVVGTAPVLDLAVIKINANHLPTVTLGNSSNLQVGQKVLAIGNPFGLPGTMTRGIISSIRSVRDPGGHVNIENAIQTDAAINPGNSGGPLLNSQGQVIGIDSAIYGATGSNVGIGFAIPINEAKAVLKDLITTGHVERPSLGISEYIDLSPYLAQELNLPVRHGVLVVKVKPGGAAARAGLRGGHTPGYYGDTPVEFGGDVITAVNGERIESGSDLERILILDHAGQWVTLTVARGGKTLHLRVQLGQKTHGQHSA